MNGLSVLAKDAMLDIFAGKLFLLALYSGDDEIVDALYQRREAFIQKRAKEYAAGVAS